MSRTLSLRKNGNRYYARFYDGSRKRGKRRKEISLKTGRKDVAERKVVELREDFERGYLNPWAGDLDREELTLDAACRRFLAYKAERVRESTLGTYRGNLRRWRTHCPNGLLLSDVQADHLRPYVHDSCVAQSTRHKRYRHIKVFLRWCVEKEHIHENPLNDLTEPEKGKKVPVYLSPKQLGRLMRYIEWHGANVESAAGIKPDVEWLRDAIVIAVGTGLRRGELLNLRWSDVELDERRLRVRNRDGFRTKNGSERVVPVRGDALEVLRRRYEQRDAFDGPVIVDRDGTAPRPERLTRGFKRMVRGAGLKGREDLHFHSLRHTCGAWLASQGISARIIQEILGHASSATTQIYSHVTSSALEDAVERTFGA